MTATDTVNRVYREFKRYTGDGLPGEPTGASLPVGDPQSGVHSPKKSELRAALIAVLTEAGVAVGEAQEALDDLLARYLGPYANDAAATAAAGSPTEGQLYFDTTLGKLKVWHSGAWISSDAALNDGDVTEPKLSAGLKSRLEVAFETMADALAYAPASAPNAIRTNGYATVGDYGGALYKKVASEPAHDGKFSITLSDAVTVVWYELSVDAPTPQMFGYIPDGATTDTGPGIQAAADYVLSKSESGGVVLLPPTSPAYYRIASGSEISGVNGVTFRGSKFGTEIRYEGTGFAFTWGTSTDSVLNYGGGVDGFYIVLTNKDGNGFSLYATVNCVIQNGKIEGVFADFATKTNTGIVISGADASSFWNVVQNVQMSHIYEGIVLTCGTVNATQQTFINVGIVGNYSSGTTLCKGILITGGTNDNGAGTVVVGCYFENLRYGLQHNSVSGAITVTGCEFELADDGTAKDVFFAGSGNGNASSYFGNHRLQNVGGTPSEGGNQFVRGIKVLGDMFRLGGDGASNNDWFEFYETIFAAGLDNTVNLGSGGQRFGTVFAATGTINTSDEREKEQIEGIPDEWLDAWADVNWVRFKWRDAVAEKGEEARWHIGLIAQQVRDAFAGHGIDAHKIGLLCYDEWEDSPHNDRIKAGNRYGLRYEQCEAMEAAFQRRRMDRLEAALAAI